ncbi:MFS transporter [Aliarcobacter butzleri]|uniref:MFS transporter n=1 Tax=Aliarcobacter butzleri TaxID=28197 RepID=UPI001EDEF2A5|nr:MFS transporter [Aliarcobacter butzleri]MCG3673845.1 MFS transporter [Aliarcobacter butzleri]MCG3696454.1 MFS transporter [Aliarcobacter butzleri]MCG3698592.1 MFS transporter [Aliarcobacter butzleri]MCT7619023.1 MFS transporter [Aliarcobacter butzleri]MDN5079137.1 MFS transporter [Aliarcobacter butzleri]
MITKKQIFVMSATAGISVANIYYNQPILNNIAKDLGVSYLSVGNLPTFSQIGYGLGLFFVSPLGDKIDRKKLLIILHILLGLSLLGLSFINNIYVIYALSLFVGLFAVSAQVVIPMAVSMSNKDKGKVVGTIFSGLLTGILSARTLSGYVTDWFDNWHAVFLISSIFVFTTIFFILKVLPNVEANFSNSYFSLLKSSVYQLKRFSLLRKNTLLIVLLFGIFCSFWTTLTFKLSQAPFNYDSDVIGLFGLLAVAGAMLAPYLGKLSDKINANGIKIISILMTIFSIFLIRWFDTSLIAFIVAILLLDIGFQAIQINNLSQIYSLDEKAHSRINTAYMSSMFLGGSIGTFIGVLCWETGGWDFVTLQLLVLSFISLGVILTSNKK